MPDTNYKPGRYHLRRPPQSPCFCPRTCSRHFIAPELAPGVRALRGSVRVTDSVCRFEAHATASKRRRAQNRMKGNLLPTLACAATMILFSSSVHGARRMPGSSWFMYLSRHCLPVRPCICVSMNDQRFVPYRQTSWTSLRSSCASPVNKRR